MAIQSTDYSAGDIYSLAHVKPYNSQRTFTVLTRPAHAFHLFDVLRVYTSEPPYHLYCPRITVKKSDGLSQLSKNRLYKSKQLMYGSKVV
jgi:hypothetical protein